MCFLVINNLSGSCVLGYSDSQIILLKMIVELLLSASPDNTPLRLDLLLSRPPFRSLSSQIIMLELLLTSALLHICPSAEVQVANNSRDRSPWCG